MVIGRQLKRYLRYLARTGDTFGAGVFGLVPYKLAARYETASETLVGGRSCPVLPIQGGRRCSCQCPSDGMDTGWQDSSLRRRLAKSSDRAVAVSSPLAPFTQQAMTRTRQPQTAACLGAGRFVMATERSVDAVSRWYHACRAVCQLCKPSSVAGPLPLPLGAERLGHSWRLRACAVHLSILGHILPASTDLVPCDTSSFPRFSARLIRVFPNDVGGRTAALTSRYFTVRLFRLCVSTSRETAFTWPLMSHHQRFRGVLYGYRARRATTRPICAVQSAWASKATERRRDAAAHLGQAGFGYVMYSAICGRLFKAGE
ncbi:hypothetical protein VTK56DRAFT_7563 [Thermocarpiscus australiensis]